MKLAGGLEAHERTSLIFVSNAYIINTPAVIKLPCLDTCLNVVVLFVLLMTLNDNVI